MTLQDLVKDHQSSFLVVGLVFIGFFFLTRLNRRTASKGETTLTPEEQIERLRESRGMHGDLEKLMAEIEDLAKRLEGRLDAKSQQVEKLIAEMDRRIAELSRLQGQSTAKADRVSVAPLPAPPLTPPELPNDPLSRSVYQLADAGHSPPEIARKLNEQIGKVELILALRQA